LIALQFEHPVNIEMLFEERLKLGQNDRSGLLHRMTAPAQSGRCRLIRF
jgi:hypothetical protein